MIRIAAFLYFIHLSLVSQGQVITTIAGTGTEGFSGDGGLAVAAALNKPIGIGVDDSGNIYIADTRNARIRKVNPKGIITTIAGTGIPGNLGDGGLATAAQLYTPTDVAIDHKGNIYIADIKNNTIRKVDKVTGVINIIAGNGISGYSGDNGLATAAAISTPQAIAVDTSGNLFIADYNNSRVRKVSNATGIITTIAGTGATGFSGDGGIATAAELFNPSGVAVNRQGDVFIADTYNNRIRKVNSATGIITTIAGNGTTGYSGDGGLATLAALSQPVKIALDDSSNFWIADINSNRLRKVSSATGIISTVAGTGIGAYSGDGGAATSAQLYSPTDVAVDPSGNIYIADYGNTRIRKISFSTLTVDQAKQTIFISVSPNPTLGCFGIKSSSVIKKIAVYNLFGRLVLQKECDAQQINVDITHLDNGIYLIKINDCIINKIAKL